MCILLVCDFIMGHRCRDRIVVRFTTTDVVSANLTLRRGVLDTIQHYVIKFVSDLRQIDGFFRILRSPPPIKLIATI